MKKLFLISKESIFAGALKSGIGEIIDSLANSLTADYEVSIVSVKKSFGFATTIGTFTSIKRQVSHIKFSKVNYYLIESNVWDDRVIELLNTHQPQIIHNFDDPTIINNLNYTPEKCIYTADTQDEIIELDLSKYDEVTVTSSNNLTNPNIKYIPNGLISLATPIKGLLLAAPYSSTLLTGKSINKKKLISTYGLPKDGYICLVAGLMNDNVLDEIIDAIPTILETGGSIIIATLSNHRYIDKIKPYKDSPRVVFFDHNPSAAVIPLLLAGSDFYLHPNKSTMSNLIPLLAGAYGTIPVIGTETEFNDSDIIINNNYEEAIRCAADLYMNQPKQLANMRKNIMESIPSWDDRKQAYINLYENNKA